jgi:hypothetical protein
MSVMNRRPLQQYLPKSRWEAWSFTLGWDPVSSTGESYATVSPPSQLWRKVYIAFPVGRFFLHMTVVWHPFYRRLLRTGQGASLSGEIHILDV